MSATKVKPAYTPKALNPKKSIQRARNERNQKPKWSLVISDDKYTWTSRMEKVNIIRNGLPYESLEVISKKTNLPVKRVLRSI